MPAPRPLRTPTPLAALGFASIVPATVSAAALAPGGLAPIAMAVIIAIGLGVPLAQIEWRSPRGTPTPLDAARQTLADLWALLLVGAVAGPWVKSAGGAGVSLAAASWLAAGLGAWAGARSAPIVVPTALAVGVAGAATGVAAAPPWTLLEPAWGGWRGWLATAVLWGFLLAAAGFGHWAALPGPAPGQRRRAWVVPGGALALALLVALQAAASFEVGASAGLASTTAALSLVAAGTALLERDGARAHPARYAAGGFAATAWFAGPGFDALPLWWGGLALLGPAAWCGLLGWSAQGIDRGVAAVGSAVLVGAAFVAWPGAPDAAGAAAAAALLVVVAVWVAGTRALVGRPA